MEKITSHKNESLYIKWYKVNHNCNNNIFYTVGSRIVESQTGLFKRIESVLKKWLHIRNWILLACIKWYNKTLFSGITLLGLTPLLHWMILLNESITRIDSQVLIVPCKLQLFIYLLTYFYYVDMIDLWMYCVVLHVTCLIILWIIVSNYDVGSIKWK